MKTETEKGKRRAEREAWRAEEAIKREELKVELAKEYGIPRDAFFDKIWDIAWCEGHSSGYEQVKCCFAGLSDLFELR